MRDFGLWPGARSASTIDVMTTLITRFLIAGTTAAAVGLAATVTRAYRRDLKAARALSSRANTSAGIEGVTRCSKRASR